MSSSGSNIRHQKDMSALMKERLLWLTKPLGAVILVLWIMSPSTSAQVALQEETLKGFLFGALYGLFFYNEVLIEMLFTRRHNIRKVKNRLPDEFYWGKKTAVLFAKK